ncbi:MAG TPA: hypothetical protein G4N95_09755 [Anaerolineae bacterium]|nr:hypothetical protein [Anaerolineae bacterium]
MLTDKPSPKIDDFRFGRIIINNKPYHHDVIIFPDHIKPNWRRKEGHMLYVEDLEEVLAYSPDKLIVGCGTFSKMKVPESTLEILKSKGINVVVQKTQEACKTYNQLKQKSNIVAALHLTC